MNPTPCQLKLVPLLRLHLPDSVPEDLQLLLCLVLFLLQLALLVEELLELPLEFYLVVEEDLIGID